MATRQTSFRNTKAIVGSLLLSIGLFLSLANLDAVAARASNSFTPPAGLLGTALEIALAALRAAQAYLFEPSSFHSALQQILLSFWPLILVIIGAALLRNTVSQRLPNGKIGLSSTSGASE